MSAVAIGLVVLVFIVIFIVIGVVAYGSSQGWFEDQLVQAGQTPAQLTSFMIGEAGSPHRMWIGTTKDWETKGWGGWRIIIYFDAYTSQAPGTVPFTVGFREDPWRAVITQGSSPADGFKKLYTFYAYSQQAAGTSALCWGNVGTSTNLISFVESGTGSCNDGGFTHGGVFYAKNVRDEAKTSTRMI